MIICQPRKPVVYLISTLLGGSFLLTGMGLYASITSREPSLLLLFLVCLLLALLLFLTIRLATGYHKITASPTQLTVHYILLGRANTYALSSITSIDEVKINTFGKKQFRQLILHIGQEKITLNNQVYSQYDQLKNLLNQRKTGRTPKSPRK